LKRGESALVVVTPEHRELLCLDLEKFESVAAAAIGRVWPKELGAGAGELKTHVGYPRPYWALMPNTQTILLGLREYVPRQAEDILARARRLCLE
jgi:hypothetical protein